jgi:hypothetical protein
MASAPSMNRNWEDVFGSWGAAPSATGQEKCANAERASTFLNHFFCRLRAISYC